MAVVIRWTTPAKKTLDIVQNTYYTNSFHLRVAHPPRRRSFCHGRMLYKKNLASRLPEERPISTFHMKQPEYLESVQRIFLRPEDFLREIFQIDTSIEITRKIDTYIKRQISLSPTFQIHRSSSYAQVVYYFL